MDKQELAFIEMRLTMLEKMVFQSEKNIKEYLQIGEELKKIIQYGNVEDVRLKLEQHLQHIASRLSDPEE